MLWRRALLTAKSARFDPFDRAPFLLSKELRVSLDVHFVFDRDVVIEIDGRDRTFGYAGAAVDALVRIDEHLDPGEALSTLAVWNCA